MSEQVLIVGAGPVGLLLALRLESLGVRARVLEQRETEPTGSRSIGIHPPSLEQLDSLGIGERFTGLGVRVGRGHAYSRGKRLGLVDFGACPGPHRYVLTLAQRDTETLLREALEERAPGSLVRGVRVLDVTQHADGMRVKVHDERAGERTLDAAFVVGCDGRNSTCRSAAAIGFRGERYAGGYLMGDAPDTTNLGSDAAVFLSEEGLVESFPLPRGIRRWVVRRSRVQRDGAANADELCDLVRARTAYTVEAREVVELSAFRAERFVADRLTAGRLVLAGDAAHVVSPIGGQGMNLGWLGAWSLADALAIALRTGDLAVLTANSRSRRRMAQAAARRAEVNMWLGSPGERGVRDPLVATLMRPALADAVTRGFTMRGLKWGI